MDIRSRTTAKTSWEQEASTASVDPLLAGRIRRLASVRVIFSTINVVIGTMVSQVLPRSPGTRPTVTRQGNRGTRDRSLPCPNAEMILDRSYHGRRNPAIAAAVATWGTI
jgi:hypothetical protein